MYYRMQFSPDQLRQIGDRYADEATSLEQGVDYEVGFFNGDNFHVYDVVPAEPDNARHARWVSDALRDPDLADEFLERLPTTDLAAIRHQVEGECRPADTSHGHDWQRLSLLMDKIAQERRDRTDRR